MRLDLLLCAVGLHRWRIADAAATYRCGDIARKGRATYRVCRGCGRKQWFDRLRELVGQPPWFDAPAERTAP